MINFLKNVYHKLPIIRELHDLRRNHSHATRISAIAQINIYRELLLQREKYQDPRRLIRFESQTFSQNGEDGIIAEIFRRVGDGTRRFVEIGVGGGLENNTALLLAKGWEGFWYEGGADNVKSIQTELATSLRAEKLKLRFGFITAENCQALLEELSVPMEIDLFSLDIDRNTYHIWAALKKFQPRVAVIEYNAAFPPDMDWVIDYRCDGIWDQFSIQYGASLKALERLGNDLGYSLVGCDFSGNNAFFVRKDQPLDRFCSPFTAENHYEPPRYWTERREAHQRKFSVTTY